jgi:DNA-binding CsgD family transcriptional regulator
MSSSLPKNMSALISLASKHSSTFVFNEEEHVGHSHKEALILNSQLPVYFVLDYTSYKYLYIGPHFKNLLGYEADFMMNEGPKYYNDLIHPTDKIIFNEKITANNIKFISTLDHRKINDYFFTANYRIQDPNGEYRKILQRSCCAEISPTGLPLVIVGFALDITHFKDNNSMVHTIEKINSNSGADGIALIYKTTYHPQDNLVAITKREMEIVRLLAHGLNSSAIAAKLFISEHTVKNHRKNILKKAGVSSTAALIRYASSIGWL